jgi:hypothetical protein
MRYYLDTNALIKLYYKKQNNLDLYKNTSVSMLVVAEMLKFYNWEQDYVEHRNQLKFITDNGISINWKSFDSIISRAFTGKELMNNQFSAFKYVPSIFMDVREFYSTLIECETYDSFIEKFPQKSSYMPGSIPKAFAGDLLKAFFNSSFIQDSMLNYEKSMLGDRNTYQIEKEIRNDFLTTIVEMFRMNLSLSEVKIKQLSRKMKKEYDKSLDLFIKCKAKYIADGNIILKNDGVDLLHLLYVNTKENDIFVSNDKNLVELIKSISNLKIINIKEYININNGYGT